MLSFKVSINDGGLFEKVFLVLHPFIQLLKLLKHFVVTSTPSVRLQLLYLLQFAISEFFALICLIVTMGFLLCVSVLFLPLFLGIVISIIWCYLSLESTIVSMQMVQKMSGRVYSGIMGTKVVKCFRNIFKITFKVNEESGDSERVNSAGALQNRNISCTICMEEVIINNPVRCQQCSQVVGCNDCVSLWFHSSNLSAHCPLCRDYVPCVTSAQTIDIFERRCSHFQIKRIQYNVKMLPKILLERKQQQIMQKIGRTYTTQNKVAKRKKPEMPKDWYMMPDLEESTRPAEESYEGTDCIICCRSLSSHIPAQCKFCKQIVGCESCIYICFKNDQRCPFCRHKWELLSNCVTYLM
ncbi:unnamed protein product [Bursaphelenchus okinawaensis]|uniref:RING-type domain-containing protein n=1 Tax=Bursaphelenchus okinawaensis TaxID=465554 RepID=A0A811KT30_9BILA|nr:unnamed protein product [Bursaphelenchus okinawaensis]CAG9112216.1 unnamed protein product [Bursaphelenchus okinawaensis]